MALSKESLSYLISAMGSTPAGQELINAIQSPATLSADSTTRLKTAFGNDFRASNFQSAILGTHVLDTKDLQYVTDAFSAPLTVVSSILDNLVVGSPKFSPAAGAYGPTQSVTLSSITPGAKIYYTTDGSTPTTSSTLYSGAISVSSTETIKAIASTDGTHNSSVVSATYTIDGAVATPTFSPVAGSYTGAQTVTISCSTSGASLYYTTDGSTPTTASTLYSAPITVSASETVKVLGTKAGFSNSAIASAAYVIS